jgi:hypothetical protein
MSNTILLKRSNTNDSIPSTGNLVQGEMALNYADGNLFFKDATDAIVLLSSKKLVEVTGNITGNNIIGNTSGIFGNITISGSNVNTNADVVTINSLSNDADFSINGSSIANIFYIDAGQDSVSVGNNTQINDAILTINSTDSMVLPRGNIAQRPGSPAVGMTRYNVENDSGEIYTNGSGWLPLGVEFTVVASETFNGNGYQTVFTLATPQTTNSCIISINGIVQQPTTAYSISGTTLTFTSAPGSGLVIEVRKLTTTTTVTKISNGPSTAVVEPDSTDANVFVTGNLVPTANATQSLGAPGQLWSQLYVDGADIAENYLADADYEPGTVVVFGGSHEITIANSLADKRVAGIITTKPSCVMNSGLQGEHVAPVGLLGRMPCFVIGPVKKGDMLVSGLNGHAIACTSPNMGEVIGKSLVDFDDTSGIIEVVVGKI